MQWFMPVTPALQRVKPQDCWGSCAAHSGSKGEVASLVYSVPGQLRTVRSCLKGYMYVCVGGVAAAAAATK